MKALPLNRYFKNTQTPESLLAWTLSAYLLFSMVSISLSQIFISVSFLLWIVLLLKKKITLSFPSFFWPLIAYTVLSLVSSFFSVNPQTSLRDSRELLLFLVIPMVYVAFHKKKEIQTAYLALLGSAFLSTIYSLFYAFTSAYPGERITGFMGHYMTQAGLLLLFSCVSLGYLFLSRRKLKWVWGLGLGLSLVALALTLTRSAWVGLVVGACVILLLYKPPALILVPVAVGLFFVASPKHIQKRALSIFTLRNSTNQIRMEYLQAGLEIIGDFPVWGTGPDTVDMVFKNPKYGLSQLASENVHLHNNILQIAAERGIPALAAWLTFMVWAFLSLVQLLRNKDPTLRFYAGSALAALLALASAGLFEYNFADSEVVTLFLFILTGPFAQEKGEPGTRSRIQKKREPSS